MESWAVEAWAGGSEKGAIAGPPGRIGYMAGIRRGSLAKSMEV